VEEARERGVLLNCAHENVVRLLPPLVAGKEQLDRVIKVLDEVL
jgi:acetylornithine/succinyldiaminopimelate/putrescine aminotransferase